MGREMFLTEVHEKEFAEFMRRATESLQKVIRNEADSLLSSVYTDFGMYLETDSWINYREALKKELAGGLYKTVTNYEEGYWAKGVRDMIFLEHKDELVLAINQDLLNEVATLKEELKNKSRFY